MSAVQPTVSSLCPLLPGPICSRDGHSLLGNNAIVSALFVTLSMSLSPESAPPLQAFHYIAALAQETVQLRLAVGRDVTHRAVKRDLKPKSTEAPHAGCESHRQVQGC